MKHIQYKERWWGLVQVHNRNCYTVNIDQVQGISLPPSNCVKAPTNTTKVISNWSCFAILVPWCVPHFQFFDLLKKIWMSLIPDNKQYFSIITN